MVAVARDRHFFFFDCGGKREGLVLVKLKKWTGRWLAMTFLYVKEVEDGVRRETDMEGCGQKHKPVGKIGFARSNQNWILEGV